MYHRHLHRSGWRLTFLFATLISVCAHLPLQWLKSYLPTLILQSPLVGIALGTLTALSTLVLSTHYRANVPLVSTQSGFMGFLGAVVYAIVGVRPYAHTTTAVLLSVTLLAAN